VDRGLSYVCDITKWILFSQSLWYSWVSSADYSYNVNARSSNMEGLWQRMFLILPLCLHCNLCLNGW
jgi:hypothetical protein